jgi:glyoxylase-like metal-dependent hydrolase (beta-lactamase superfamily II)
MLEVAQGVWQLPLAPRQSVNAYLVGDVLVDAGTAGMGKKLPGRLAGRPVAAHAITHAHPDHVGGSKAVVDALGVPFWCPSGDAAAVEAGMSVPGESKLKPVLSRGSGFPSVPIARQLDEGDEVAGFTVLHTPGALGRPHRAVARARPRADRGDVFFNLHLATLRPGLRQPPGPFTVDPAQNRASERRLAALAPSTVCFGHGPVLRDAAPKLEAFVAALPG